MITSWLQPSSERVLEDRLSKVGRCCRARLSGRNLQRFSCHHDSYKAAHQTSVVRATERSYHWLLSPKPAPRHIHFLKCCELSHLLTTNTTHCPALEWTTHVLATEVTCTSCNQLHSTTRCVEEGVHWAPPSSCTHILNSNTKAYLTELER
jgi:hypothetical protein